MYPADVPAWMDINCETFYQVLQEEMGDDPVDSHIKVLSRRLAGGAKIG